VYQWLDGTPASAARIVDLSEVAVVLARFLACLQKIDPTEGPPPGPHNLFRAAHWRPTTPRRKTIATVQGMINTELATEVWQTALATIWYGGPVWIHGDVAAGNLQADQAAAATARRVINEVLDEHVHAV